jgi:hypothetical protein
VLPISWTAPPSLPSGIQIRKLRFVTVHRTFRSLGIYRDSIDLLGIRMRHVAKTFLPSLLGGASRAGEDARIVFRMLQVALRRDVVPRG